MSRFFFGKKNVHVVNLQHVRLVFVGPKINIKSFAGCYCKSFSEIYILKVLLFLINFTISEDPSFFKNFYMPGN